MQVPCPLFAQAPISLTQFIIIIIDGILNKEFAKVLAQGSGSVHGIDSSDAMIQSAKELCKDEKNATFEGSSTINIIIHYYYWLVSQKSNK